MYRSEDDMGYVIYWFLDEIIILHLKMFYNPKFLLVWFKFKTELFPFHCNMLPNNGRLLIFLVIQSCFFGLWKIVGEKKQRDPHIPSKSDIFISKNNNEKWFFCLKTNKLRSMSICVYCLHTELNEFLLDLQNKLRMALIYFETLFLVVLRCNLTLFTTNNTCN